MSTSSVSQTATSVLPENDLVRNTNRTASSETRLNTIVPAENVSVKNATKSKRDYKGFVAGVFSGIAKLSVGHPFDTIKIRMQTSEHGRFRGPLDCVMQTIRKEGFSGFYKGATPPLVGWMIMDSVMLGSLTLYKRLLLENVFSNPQLRNAIPFTSSQRDLHTLPSFGHGIAGIMAGCTVSFIAAPVEHVKARLQIQYAADKKQRMYSGPIDCSKKILRSHGIPGLFRGLCATLIFRSFFFFWWGSYDIITRIMQKKTNLSAPAINFWAGGISAQIFWITSYPSDVVKNRLMTDPLGGSHGDGERRFPRWKDAAVAVYRERVLAAILAIGFIFFLFDPASSSTPITAQQRQEDAASHPLSPPTKPFPKKHAQGRNGQQAPPPVVHYKMNELTTSDASAQKGERVLILTPMMNFYQQYWDNLVKLQYPHELISLGFILPKTNEGNAATLALQEAVSKTQSGPIDDRFASVTILRQDFEPPLQSQDEKERHKMENQKKRREAMSRARNSLLFTTLGPSTSWVLWLDSDIVETPPTLIEDLTSHNKPVIVPNCYQRYLNPETGQMDVRAYDYNSWIDSDIALQLAAEMDPDDVLFEGYAEIPTYRSLMVWMVSQNPEDANPHNEVELDGVGGTALMVKADVHRDGAMFPPFPFYHMLETEGFAKMAKRLGYTCWGLPDYFVYHYNE
ncbi:Anp1 [Penicillium occitanis (nom. inval.)]|nr:Anp1 [Penicillium occitanis (nom. inval.)]PCG90786.1 hypothetical protein PENOC_100380 [Penicillium occitanis (nom. inval.)]